MRKFKDAFKLFCTDWCDSRNLLITAFIAVLLGILATVVVAICNVLLVRNFNAFCRSACVMQIVSLVVALGLHTICCALDAWGSVRQRENLGGGTFL